MEKINKFFGYKNEVFDKKNLERKPKKDLQIIKEIKEKVFPSTEGCKTISFSQIQMYNECPKKWELQYKLGHREPSPSINMTFGTAIHETIQNYLDVMYSINAVEADKIDLEEYFETKFIEIYKRDYETNGKKHFSNPDEMHEFLGDGFQILNFFKKKRGEYFSKRDWHLVGCELPIVIQPNNRVSNVYYKGFLDIVLYHEPTNHFYIYDIKTSRSGWSKTEQKDEVKQSQLLLYKKFFAEQFNVPLKNISIEFFILRRKLWEKSKYPQKRIQQFSPSNGDSKIKQSTLLLDKFLDECFTNDGFKERNFQPQPSSKCKWCPYNNKPELCSK